MAFPLAAGMPTYSGVSIPALWPVEMLMKFYAKTVLPQIASTDHEDELKKMGDVAHIRVIPTFTSRTYYAGMTLVPNLTVPTVVDLNIDKGLYFNEQIDDLIAQQSDIKLSEKYNEALSATLAVDVDKAVLAGVQTGADSSNSGTTAGIKSGAYDLGTTGAAIPITEDNALKCLVDLIAVIRERDIDDAGMWALIPYWFARKLKTGDLKQANEMGDKTSPVRTGLLGRIDGIDIIQSNNMTSVTDGTDSSTCWYALAGHKSAITFAATFEQFRVMQPSDSFSKLLQIVKVYGYKVQNDDYLGALYCKPTT